MSIHLLQDCIKGNGSVSQDLFTLLQYVIFCNSSENIKKKFASCLPRQLVLPHDYTLSSNLKPPVLSFSWRPTIVNW